MKKIWYWDRYTGDWKLAFTASDTAFLTADEVARIWTETMEYRLGMPTIVSTDTPS